MNLKGVILYVYEAKTRGLEIVQPTTNEVPDVLITGELWVMNNVKIKKKYKIEVIDAFGDKASYKVSSVVQGESYFWNYKILKEY